MGVSKNMGKPPNHPLKNRVFHVFSIHFWGTLILVVIFVKIGIFPKDRGENSKIFELPPPRWWKGIQYLVIGCITMNSGDLPDSSETACVVNTWTHNQASHLFLAHPHGGRHDRSGSCQAFLTSSKASSMDFLRILSWNVVCRLSLDPMINWIPLVSIGFHRKASNQIPLPRPISVSDEFCFPPPARSSLPHETLPW